MATKARVLPRFPARVLGTNGLSITKTNGVWTFARDHGALTALGSVDAGDRDNLFVVTYNSEGSPTYARISLDVLVSAISAGLDATLVAIGGLTPGADQSVYFTATDTAALFTITSAGRSLLDDADASAMRTTLGLVIGTDVQAFDSELAALAGLTSAADKLPYFTGAGTAAVTDLTSFSRTALSRGNAANWRTDLGVVIGTDVQAFDADLSALAALSGTGIARRTGAATWATGTTVTVAEGGTGQTTEAEAVGELIQALSADTAPQPSLDYLGGYDDSADTGKKYAVETIVSISRGHPGYGSNRYYIPGTGNAHSTSTLAVTANRLYATPIFIGKRTTWTRIGIDVTILAAGNARLGIFTTGTDGLPGTLVLDAGTVSTGTTGIKEVTISQVLEVGFYNLVVVFDAAPTVRALSTAQASPNFSDFMGTGTPGTYDYGTYRAFTYGVLSGASPFGAPTFGADNPLMITLRVV